MSHEAAIAEQATAACVAAIGLAVGAFAYAARWPTSQLFGRTMLGGNDPDEIALTFDDGPNPAVTPKLLDVLAHREVRATFFLVGNFARDQPALVRQIADLRHAIGSHTMTHPRLSLQPEARIRQELAQSKTLLEDLTGNAVQCFRPPFGSRRPAVLRIARELGLIPVMWNVTGHDWDPIGADRILANVERGIARNRRLGRGSNVLLHDGGNLGLNADRLDTIAATDRLLAQHGNDGMRWITLDALSPQATAM